MSAANGRALPRAAVALAVAGALLVACTSSAGDSLSPSGTDATATTQGADSPDPDNKPTPVEFSAVEDAALDECTSATLGRPFTLDQLIEGGKSQDTMDDEGRWEQARSERAYEQCIFELFMDRIDLEDPAWEMAYRHAYALDLDGNPVMDDPLAPWADRETTS